MSLYIGCKLFMNHQSIWSGLLWQWAKLFQLTWAAQMWYTTPSPHGVQFLESLRWSHHLQMPTQLQLTSLEVKKQHSASVLSSLHPYFTPLQLLLSSVSFFRSLPKAHDHRWGSEEIKGFVFQPSYSFTTTVRYNARIIADAAPVRPSISRSILPSLWTKHRDWWTLYKTSLSVYWSRRLHKESGESDGNSKVMGPKNKFVSAGL